MVKTREVYNQLVRTLCEAGIEDAGFEADTMIAHMAGAHRLQVDTLDDETCHVLQEMARNRSRRQPLQYLLGEWDFLHLRLSVGPGVLIPRPETEEVCLAAAACLQGKTAPTVLDLCAGSGALALGLQSLCPTAHITAVELYEEAFFYLAKNLRLYAQQYPTTPLAVQADVHEYHQKLPPESQDLIVSNPPYIREEEYPLLGPELAHEPKTALVAGEDGLCFYRVIITQYWGALKPGGALVLEIGAEQAAAVSALLTAAGFASIRVQNDLQGQPRIVSALRPIP